MQLSKALRVRAGHVIAFTGAGGKTAAAQSIAKEAASGSIQGVRSVLFTTTTRLREDQTEFADQHLIDPLENEVYKSLVDHSSVVVTGPELEGKWIPPSDRLLAQLDRIVGETGSLLLIEADGARGRSLKAPAKHEPVIPGFTDLVVPIAGLDVIGKRIDSDAVHRPELVRSVVKARSKTEIEPQHVAKLIASEAGGLKNVPEGAEVRPILSKAEEDLRQPGAQIAQMLLQNSRIKSVALASLFDDEPVREAHCRIAGVVLAAGGSARLGEPKQLIHWRGHPLVWHAVHAAEALQQIFVVAGESVRETRRALKGEPVQILENPDWESGQSSSVRQGVQAAAESAEAIVFLLADMPFVGPDLVAALVDRHRQTLSALVATRAGGRRANPVLFDRATFDQLRDLSGDEGGRAIFHEFQPEYVDWDDSVLLDVDTPDDLERLRELE